MNRNTDRSPVWGLTAQQFTTLDRRHREKKLGGRADSTAWREVGAEAAHRCAALLAANDVRGALYEAEIWQGAQAHERAAAAFETRAEVRNANADARLAAQRNRRGVGVLTPVITTPGVKGQKP